MTAQYFEFVIWSLGCVSALAASWLTDRRDCRREVQEPERLRSELHDQISEIEKRTAVLENKIDECLRRVDRS